MARTEHPDYVRAKTAHEAARAVFEAAEQDLNVRARVLAENACRGYPPSPDEVAEYRRLEEAAETARAAWYAAGEEWQAIRVQLGLARSPGSS